MKQQENYSLLPPIHLTVVVPAFNEESNLSLVVEDTIQFLTHDWGEKNYELILIDDGSTDSTGHIADQLGQQYEQVRVYHHSSNRGFGAALKTGFINAAGIWVSYIAGDGQVSVDQVIKLYNEIGDADLIVSARQENNHKDVQTNQSFYRQCLTVGLRYILIFSLGFNFSGKEGIFLIRNDVLKTLRLRSKTGLLAVEIIMQCYRNGLTVKESTIMTQPRISGQSKVTNFSTYLKYFWEIFKLRFKG